MARDVAPILQLVAFCAVIPSAGVVMILFPDTFLWDGSPEQISERLKQIFLQRGSL
jgi:hypothetical protein